VGGAHVFYQVGRKRRSAHGEPRHQKLLSSGLLGGKKNLIGFGERGGRRYAKNRIVQTESGTPCVETFEGRISTRVV